MKQFLSAYELLKSGERAIVVYTDGLNFTDHGNGTGSTGWWGIGKKQKFDRVIVYRRKGEDITDNDVYTGNMDKKEGPNKHERYKLHMTDFKLAGETASDWRVFADTFSKEIRYLNFRQSLDDAVEEIEQELESAGEFDNSNEQDAKEKVLRSIVLRRGQPKFRANLLRAYARKCAITETCVADILEAAHITPYNGPSTNHVTNGLLLRSDIHALFDLGLLSIDPKDFRIYCAKQIRREPMYSELNEKPLRVPEKAIQKPNQDALRNHFEKRVP